MRPHHSPLVPCPLGRFEIALAKLPSEMAAKAQEVSDKFVEVDVEIEKKMSDLKSKLAVAETAEEKEAAEQGIKANKYDCKFTIPNTTLSLLCQMRL